MSIFAIVELIVMFVCGILALEQLIWMFNNNVPLSNAWNIIKIIVDILIVTGLVFIIIGLFCSMSGNSIRTGILCFLIGAILSVVLIVFQIIDRNNKITFENLIFMILLIVLSYFLWRQSGNL